jgi:glycosyltransferase involved in cell wall biosynthesis
VTYEDMTVVQALRHGYVEYSGLTRSESERRVAVQRQAYLRATACCTTSRWAAASIVEDYRVPAERVHVVGIGSNRTGKPAERDWTAPQFLFVGKDWHRKNGDAVLRAFARVRLSVPRARLDVVGGGPGDQQEGVTWHGLLRLEDPAERNRADDLFRQATCFVLPSRVEPSAIAYVEAATFGVASIGTTVGGSADLIADAGLVVDPDDHDGLERAMLAMCDPQRAAELGGRASRRAPLFTWDAVAARILTVLGLPGFYEPPLSRLESFP